MRENVKLLGISFPFCISSGKFIIKGKYETGFLLILKKAKIFKELFIWVMSGKNDFSFVFHLY